MTDGCMHDDRRQTGACQAKYQANLQQSRPSRVAAADAAIEAG